MPAHLQNFIKAELIPLGNVDALIEFLSRGRSDYALLRAEKSGLPEEVKLSLNSHRVYDLLGYHIIHKKHQKIIPELEAALRKNLAQLHSKEN